MEGALIVSHVVAFALGVLGGVILAYFGEFVRPLARRHEARLRKRKQARRSARAGQRQAGSDEAAFASRRAERLGARFRRREHIDDPWLTGTVVAVDRRGDHVVVEWNVSSGTERVRHAWSSLTEPANEQRHRTARLMMDPPGEDHEGWTQFERL